MRCKRRHADRDGQAHLDAELAGILAGFARYLLPLPLAMLGSAMPPWMSVANIATGLAGLLITVGLEIPRHYSEHRETMAASRTVKSAINVCPPAA